MVCVLAWETTDKHMRLVLTFVIISLQSDLSVDLYQYEAAGMCEYSMDEHERVREWW
jgi:hypothetical protein